MSFRNTPTTRSERNGLMRARKGPALAGPLPSRADARLIHALPYGEGGEPVTARDLAHTTVVVAVSVATKFTLPAQPFGLG